MQSNILSEPSLGGWEKKKFLSILQTSSALERIFFSSHIEVACFVLSLSSRFIFNLWAHDHIFIAFAPFIGIPGNVNWQTQTTYAIKRRIKKIAQKLRPCEKFSDANAARLTRISVHWIKLLQFTVHTLRG